MHYPIIYEFIEVNGIKLHIAKKGKGEKLVILLHGWPEFWYSWRFQIPVLAEQYTVVAPDLRGFNLSDKPKQIKEYRIDIVAKDIAELIPKLGFKKAYIVGHDFGGATAWAMGALYPELIEKLVVINCAHPYEMKLALKTSKQRKKSWYMFLHQIPLLPELIYNSMISKFFTTFVRGWFYNKNNFTHDDTAAYINAYKQKGAMTGSLNYYRALMQVKPNPAVYTTKIKAPTLVIWGEGDKALGIELTYNTANHIAAPYTIKYIPKCSHWAQSDCPEIVNTYLLDFLK